MALGFAPFHLLIRFFNTTKLHLSTNAKRNSVHIIKLFILRILEKQLLHFLLSNSTSETFNLIISTPLTVLSGLLKNS